MKNKVVTLGEIMLRLSIPNFKRFIQADSFDVTYGGGEANVAVTLCNYGLQGTFVTKIPDNSIGQAALNHLRKYGVDTQYIVRGGKRLGIYFLETGASLRASQIIYDRENSAIAEANIDDFDFEKIFDNTAWFHTSGITPALSDKANNLTEAALKTAKAKGITTSLDFNYRKRLWTKEKATEVLTKLCNYVDVCIGFEELAFTIDNTIPPLTEHTIEKYKPIFVAMKQRFGFTYIASTLRENNNASKNKLSAFAFDGENLFLTKKYDITMIDRIGSGDAFSGGFIYQLIIGKSLKEAAEFGVAAAALKHTIPGDFNHSTVNEVESLLKGGDDLGRLVR